MPDAVVLEIGCGQGEFTLLLAETYPQADVRGIDNSAEGVVRATQMARGLEGCRSTFAQRDLLQERELSDEDRGAGHAGCVFRGPGTCRPARCVTAQCDRLLGSRISARRHRARRPSLGLRSPHRPSSSLHCEAIAASSRGEQIRRHQGSPGRVSLFRSLQIVGHRRVANALSLMWSSRRPTLNEGTSGAALRFFTRAFPVQSRLVPVRLAAARGGSALCGSRLVIITRTPLRITLGGGGTDLPSVLRAFWWPGLVGSHRPIHLHSDQPDIYRRLLPQVFQPRTCWKLSMTSSIRSSGRPFGSIRSDPPSSW